jgi:excinuclease UvrABC nuclease subunit
MNAQHRMTDANEAMLSGFELVDADVDLASLRPNGKLKKFKGQAGVYFWVMTLNGERFMIYVGECKCLPTRIKNYANQFQPGVNNDYKMQAFQAFMRAKYPSAQLALYFCESQTREALEKEIISATRPFMNAPAQQNEAMRLAREALRKAYELYCHQNFEARLR